MLLVNTDKTSGTAKFAVPLVDCISSCGAGGQ